MSVRARFAAGVTKAFTKAGDAIETGTLNVQTVGVYNTVTGAQANTTTMNSFEFVEVSAKDVEAFGIFLAGPATANVNEREMAILVKPNSFDLPSVEDTVTLRSQTFAITESKTVLDLVYVLKISRLNP